MAATATSQQQQGCWEQCNSDSGVRRKVLDIGDHWSQNTRTQECQNGLFGNAHTNYSIKQPFLQRPKAIRHRIEVSCNLCGVQRPNKCPRSFGPIYWGDLPAYHRNGRHRSEIALMPAATTNAAQTAGRAFRKSEVRSFNEDLMSHA